MGKKYLVSILGKTPQLVTEAIYELFTKKSILIDSICIITTKGNEGSFEDALKREMKNLSKKLKLDLPIVNNENIYYASEEHGYENNVNGEETFTTTDLIFEKIRELSSEDNELHCFLSGGRKTMSVDLGMALTMFGREQDKLYHVVADHEYERKMKYFPSNGDEAKSIFLIEKPFFRLRDKLNFINNGKKFNHQEMIERTQEELDSFVNLPDLTIDTKNLSLQIADQRIVLSPLPFSIYLFFAKSKNFIKGGKNISSANSSAIWKIYKKYSTSQGQRDRVHKSSFNNETMEFSTIQKAISDIRSKINKQLNKSPIVEHYVISNEGAYADKRYGIKLHKNKIKYI